MESSFSKKFKYQILGKKALIVSFSLLLLVTIFFALFLNRIQTKYSIKQFQPKNHPSIDLQEKIRNNFLLTETSPILISLTHPESETWLEDDSLHKLSELTEQLEELESVEYLTTIQNLPIVILGANHFNLGSISDLEDKARVLENPTIVPQFLSQDGRATNILLHTEPLSKENRSVLISELNRILEENFSEEFYLSGIPVFGNEMSRMLNSEIALFTLLSLILALLVISIVFKGIAAPIICFFSLLVLNILSLGILNILDLPFTVLTSSIPILIAITYISIASHYQINLWKGSQYNQTNHTELIHQTSRRLFRSQILASLTTIIGFACLIPSSVPVISQFGLGVCLSVSLVTLLSLVFLPLLYAHIRLPEPRNFSFFASITTQLQRTKRVFPVLALGLLIGLVVATSLQLSKGLNWSTRLMDDLPQGNRIQLANSYIDENMGGLLPLNLVINSKSAKNSFKQSDQLLRLEGFLGWLRKQNEVGSALALSDFINLASHKERRIEDDAKIKETLFLYGTSEENPIDYFISPSGQSTRVALYLKDKNSAEIISLVSQIKEQAQNSFSESEVLVAGQALSHHQINRELSERLIFGFFSALGFIFLLILLQFRSLSWSLLAILPNLVPAVSLLSLLLIFQIPIKPGIAIVFSISLGLAFDNTIYLLNSLREQLANKTSNVDILTIFRRERGGCLLSSLTSMAGFSIFVFSQFGVSQSFGIFMVVAILSGLFADLYLLPRLILGIKVLKEKYIFKSFDSLGKDAKHA